MVLLCCETPLQGRPADDEHADPGDRAVGPGELQEIQSDVAAERLRGGVERASFAADMFGARIGLAERMIPILPEIEATVEGRLSLARRRVLEELRAGQHQSLEQIIIGEGSRGRQ